MAAYTSLARYLHHHCIPTSNFHHLLKLNFSKTLTNRPLLTLNKHESHRYRSFRTLCLDSSCSESVRVKRFSDSGIYEVILDRPRAKNAIGEDMLRGLQCSFEVINRDSSANVVMICSSVPNVFCAGADLKEWKKMNSSEGLLFVNSLRSTFSFLEALQIPTIAVIEGAALGGGLEMALSCDLRICGEDAVLGLPETGLAIIPGAGGTQRLPRLIGKTVSKELIFTGRKIGGMDAMCIGLVNYCVPAGEAHQKAFEIAQDINQKDRIAIRIAKQAINEGVETDMESALKLEEDCFERLLNTKDR